MNDQRYMFLEGNELIEEAIDRYYTDSSKTALAGILSALRERMHADGHFMIPIIADEENEYSFAFRSICTNDGGVWNVVFTSLEEYEKGAESQVLSFFIDRVMQLCLDSEADGLIINPWGQSFLLEKDHMKMIFEADGGVEYSVPDEPITPELLEDGSFLKMATEICIRNRTQLNLIKLARILRDSWVWIPCEAVMSDADYERFQKIVESGAEDGDMESLVGQEFTAQDEIRMVPDILQNGDEFFFPVFTSAEEMGEYGESFSKVQKHFLEAASLAENNEKNVAGIVINAFSEPFVIPREMFDVIERMQSGDVGMDNQE